jgi:thioredoxin-like negative regulator of GroEL
LAGCLTALGVSGTRLANGLCAADGITPGLTHEAKEMVPTGSQILLQIRGDSGVVLLALGGAWYGTSHIMAPVIEQLAAEYAGRVRVIRADAGADTGLWQQFGVRRLPALLLFNNGDLVSCLAGIIPRPQIAAVIDRQLERSM